MGVLMDSEEEVAPILANLKRYNDFSIEDKNYCSKSREGPGGQPETSRKGFWVYSLEHGVFKQPRRR